ncbi:MAG: response regulator [Proteobacteria bacterium]|nr:response regulator [Pseudomonadota bacterium]
MRPASKVFSPVSADNDQDLVRIVSDIVEKITGIQLGTREANMVKSRLSTRMSELGITTPHDYLRHLDSNRESESSALVSLLTTHHTYFFREYAQFDYLIASGLNQIIQAAKLDGRKHLRIWSMACSRGQEVYSLAMFFSQHLKAIDETITFEILGTDVDPESIAIAKNGVYRWEEVKGIPSIYAAGHWARGVGEISDFVKAKPSIKSPCRFEVMNLLDLKAINSAPQRTFDLIFCRNVFIYFELEKIKSITEAIIKRLTPGGIFNIGLSETLNNTGVQLKYHGQSIYSLPPKNDSSPKKLEHHTILKQPGREQRLAIPDSTLTSPLRVICVDDSPTILGILKSILTKQEGFEIVGTATNGVEAAELAKKIEFDAMTLDIHMPVQNGIEYLRNNVNSAHPPVIMISSVTREDAILGIQSFALGAIDYVEKPTAATIAERSDEIKTKIRAAHRAKLSQTAGKATRGALDLARAFERPSQIIKPDSSLRIIVGGAASRQKIAALLRQLHAPQPPTIVLFEGSPGILEMLATQLEIHGNCQTSPIHAEPNGVKTGAIYVGDLRSNASWVSGISIERRTSILVFGDVSASGARLLAALSGSQLILEELAYNTEANSHVAAKYVPYTSFLFDSDDFLNRA